MRTLTFLAFAILMLSALPAEAALVVDCSAALMSSLAEGAAFDAPPQVVPEIETFLQRAMRYTAPAARADAEHFLRVYRPLGILPPDQYLALVLQMTEGCSFNTCTFCTFYRDRPFRSKSPDEFRAHILAVRDYLGDSLMLRRGIFLADANALVVPQRQLVPLLQVLREELTVLKGLRGFRPDGAVPLFSFLDGFSGSKKSVDDYAELAAHGLARIYIGLESGHAPLLTWLRKPGRAADAIEAARAIKAGGVKVCVIVLIGAGGTHFAEGHVRDTIDVVNAMALGAGDLIYFSDFVSLPGQPYGQIAEYDAVKPLTVDQMRAQRRAIESGLKFIGAPPKLATYSIREFVY